MVDNGSEDGTAIGFSPNGPQGTAIGSATTSIESIGLARCLNYAASLARAPLLARLDGDDILLPDRLSVQHARMSRDANLGLLGACVDLIDGEDRPLGRRRLPLTGYRAARLHAYRKSVRPLHGHDPQISLRRGWRLSHRAQALRGLRSLVPDGGRHPEIANCEEVLARYRIHESSMSAGRPIRLAIADTCIIAAARAREDGEPEPFASGRPQLRRALKILDISRDEIRYRVLKTIVGVARLAMARGDDQLAKRLRTRAHSVAWGLSFRSYLRGFARLMACYFPANSRARRKALSWAEFSDHRHRRRNNADRLQAAARVCGARRRKFQMLSINLPRGGARTKSSRLALGLPMVAPKLCRSLFVDDAGKVGNEFFQKNRCQGQGQIGADAPMLVEARTAQIDRPRTDVPRIGPACKRTAPQMSDDPCGLPTGTPERSCLLGKTCRRRRRRIWLPGTEPRSVRALAFPGSPRVRVFPPRPGSF